VNGSSTRPDHRRLRRGALNTVSRLGRTRRFPARPETGAYSAAFLGDYFEKERYKAGRFRRPLSVVFLVVENYSSLVEQTRRASSSGADVDGRSDPPCGADSDLVAREEGSRSASFFGDRRLRGLARRSTLPEGGESNLPDRVSRDGVFLQPFFMSATSPRDGRDFPNWCASRGEIRSTAEEPAASHAARRSALLGRLRDPRRRRSTTISFGKGRTSRTSCASVKTSKERPLLHPSRNLASDPRAIAQDVA